MKSKKITEVQLHQAWEELKHANKNLADARDWHKDAEDCFNSLINRASAATVKKFMASTVLF